ncbi:hypothetical protein [Chloroflexus sp.]|uniref:hypothetical protein n=1 Tax=Chloroflexus sp. TaxID=1904827 RepID=UPI00404A1C36
METILEQSVQVSFEGVCEALCSEFQLRTRFAAIAQIARFVTPGVVQVGVSADAALPLVAFRDPTTGTIHIIGRNATAHPLTLTLRDMPAAMEEYRSRLPALLSLPTQRQPRARISMAAAALFAVMFIAPDE